MRKLTAFAYGASLIALMGATSVANASHFRGAAIVPTVDASGLMTLTTTSFWRKDWVADPGAYNITGGGAAFAGTVSNTVDQSDARFGVRTEVVQYQLSGAGTYDISRSSCCRVAGIPNASGSWDMDSRIVWDGNTANSPILFDFNAINPEVQRGVNYSDNLGATSGSGHTLSYGLHTNVGISSQATGLSIDSSGTLSIAAAATATYGDNPSSLGADMAFSGSISSSDGSMVEFDWLFDGVDDTGNNSPVVNDIVINALVGDSIDTTVLGTDPDGNPLTWSMLSFFGPGASLNPVFNPATQQFTWDTIGSIAGTYIANIRASDGSLTDVGTITINLSDNKVPEPGSLALLGLGLAGLGAASRRRRAKK